jgi:hypothetical protein
MKVRTAAVASGAPVSPLLEPVDVTGRGAVVLGGAE